MNKDYAKGESLVYAYPKSQGNRLDVSKLTEDFQLFSIKKEDVSKLVIKSDNDKYGIIYNDKLLKKKVGDTTYEVFESQQYLDEFTVFAFASGDEKGPMTKPTTLSLQNKYTDAFFNGNEGYKNFWEERNYLWKPEVTQHRSSNEMTIGRPSESFYYSEIYNQARISEQQKVFTFESGATVNNPTCTDEKNFYISRPGSVLNSAPRVAKVTSGKYTGIWFLGAWCIDSSKPRIHTDINLYNDISPEIDTYDLVVNDEMSFSFDQRGSSK